MPAFSHLCKRGAMIYESTTEEAEQARRSVCGFGSVNRNRWPLYEMFCGADQMQRPVTHQRIVLEFQGRFMTYSSMYHKHMGCL